VALEVPAGRVVVEALAEKAEVETAHVAEGTAAQPGLLTPVVIRARRAAMDKRASERPDWKLIVKCGRSLVRAARISKAGLLPCRDQGVGLPDDIGPVAVFLSSGDSRWVNGQRILVGSGQTW
jgi:hypothetical protein